MHMALDVAFGMEYLSSLRFIHGDLASRNVLVADGKHGGGLDSVRKAASLDSNKKLNGADNEYTGFGFGDEVDEDAANGADGNVAVGVTGNGTNAGGQYIKVGDGTGVAGDEVDEDAANGADGNVAVGVMGNGTNAGGQYIKVGDGTEVAGEDYEYSKNTEQAPPAKEKKKKKKKKKAEKAEKGTTETTVMNAAFDNDAAATGL
eukprot:gene5003-9191_t